MDLINALLTGFFLSFMIGPVFFVLLETSATRGVKQAIFFDLGVILADVIFITLAYYGSYTILNKIKEDPRLFFAGGILLFGYGLIIFLKEKKRKIILDKELVIVEKINWTGLFLKGFLLNFINVGVLAFWLALVIVISTNLNMNSNRVFWYFTTVLTAYFITDLGKIFLAKRLKNKMTPTVIRRIRKIMGIILMIIGIIIASKKLIPEKVINKIKEKTEKVIEINQ
jgi:threonine/homoserine/homoserine lactone efflux protein